MAAIGLQEYPPGWGAWRRCAARSLEPLPAGRRPGQRVPRVAVRGSARGRADLHGGARAGGRGRAEVAGGLGAGEGGHRGGVRGAGRRSVVAAAAREGLAGGPLDRDAFHQAMRERLPDGLLPWCRGCQSHHVRPGFWRALGPLEVTVMPEKATWALAEPPSMSLDEARAELVRRFLRVYGPATHSQLASLGPDRCRRMRNSSSRESRDELAPAAVEGRQAGSCSRRTWTGSSLRRPRRASGCSAATTPTSPSPTARRSCPTPRWEAAVPARRAPGRRARGRRAGRPLARAQEGRRARGGRRVARRAGRRRRGGDRDRRASANAPRPACATRCRAWIAPMTTLWSWR